MWRTQNGERTLAGAEARLVRESLACMVDMLDQEADGLADHWEFGIPIFDKLTWQQQVAILVDVAAAMLTSEIPPPTLTAMIEGAAAAIYENIEQFLDLELDSSNEEDASFFWRDWVLAAYREAEPADPETPDRSCRDIDEWHVLFECLHAQFFWDDDYLLEDMFVDKPPAVSRKMKNRLTIAADYFRAIPPDPRDQDLPELRRKLKELCRQP